MFLIARTRNYLWVYGKSSHGKPFFNQNYFHEKKPQSKKKKKQDSKNWDPWRRERNETKRFSKWFQLVFQKLGISKMILNDSKWCEMIQNDVKWFKMTWNYFKLYVMNHSTLIGKVPIILEWTKVEKSWRIWRNLKWVLWLRDETISSSKNKYSK